MVTDRSKVEAPSASARMYGGLVAVSRISAMVSVFLMIILVFAGVLARYVFNRPLLFTDEYGGYLLVAVVCLGLMYTQKEKQHIQIDFFTRKLSKRVLKWLWLVTYATGLVYAIILTVQVTKVALFSLERGSRAMTPVATPLAPVQLIMPVGIGLLVIALLAETIGQIRLISRK